MSLGFALDDAAWASPWRRHAVADKAALTVGTLTAGLLLPAWPVSILVVVGLSFTALALARIPWRTWVMALTLPLAFVVIGVVTIAVQVGPQPPDAVTWWQAGPLWMSEESVARAATVAGRSAAGACAVILLAVTTPLVDLVDAGRRLRIPAPALDIAALMYRLLFVLAEAAATIRQAQAARLGYVGLKRSIHSFGTLAAGVLVRAWQRARRLEDGLAGRGYVDDLTTLQRWRPHSTCFLTAVAIWLCVLVVAGTLPTTAPLEWT